MKCEILSTPILLESAAAKALAPVQQIAQRIRTDDIRRIYIAARGSSSNAGLYFRDMCETNSHIAVVEINLSVFTVYGSHIDMTGGILVAVSQGGRGVDIRKVAEETARQGIPTVAVTDFPDSPLAQCCEYILPLSVEFEHSMAATKSFTAELLTLNMLASALADAADVSAAAPAAFRRGLGLEAQISAIWPTVRRCCRSIRHRARKNALPRERTVLQAAGDLPCKRIPVFRRRLYARFLCAGRQPHPCHTAAHKACRIRVHDKPF